MAVFAVGSNVRVGIIPEAAWKVTPATPALVQQRLASLSLTTTRDELVDESITPTREQAAVRTGPSNYQGDLSGPFAPQSYDALMESVFFEVWTANVIKFGDTPKSFTFEQAFSDIATYIQYTGVVANTFTLDSPIDGFTTVSFGLIAGGSTTSDISIDADGYTPYTLTDPYTHCGGTILEGIPLAPLATVQSLNLTIDNGIEPAFVWGNCEAEQLLPGKINVTGTLTAYFPNRTLYQKFLDEESSALQFTLVQGGNSHQFFLPNIKFTSAETPIEGTGPIISTHSFRALYDVAEDSGVVVTRVVAP
jgi:hypothetical protein